MVRAVRTSIVILAIGALIYVIWNPVINSAERTTLKVVQNPFDPSLTSQQYVTENRLETLRPYRAVVVVVTLAVAALILAPALVNRKV